MGILSQLSFVVTLAFCAPLITLGAQYALAGKPLALLFLGLAALVLGFERYVRTPDDVAVSMAERAVGAVARDPNTNADADADADDGK